MYAALVEQHPLLRQAEESVALHFVGIGTVLPLLQPQVKLCVLLN